MTPPEALKCLAGIAIEYVASLKDRPSSQEALGLRIQLSHNVLNGALSPPQQPSPDEPTHDRDPT